MQFITIGVIAALWISSEYKKQVRWSETDHSNLAWLACITWYYFLITSILKVFFASQEKQQVKGPRNNCSFLPAFLSMEPKRLFTSKIIQRAEISSASVNIALSLLHVCPPTEPARLLGVSFFFPFLHFSLQHNARFLTLSVCVCVACLSVCIYPQRNRHAGFVFPPSS